MTKPMVRTEVGNGPLQLSPLGKPVEYSLYLEVTDELDTADRKEPFAEAVGLRLLYPMITPLELGLSYANFERDRARENRENLFAIDVFWRYQGRQVTDS